MNNKNKLWDDVSKIIPEDKPILNSSSLRKHIVDALVSAHDAGVAEQLEHSFIQMNDMAHRYWLLMERFDSREKELKSLRRIADIARKFWTGQSEEERVEIHKSLLQSIFDLDSDDSNLNENSK